MSKKAKETNFFFFFVQTAQILPDLFFLSQQAKFIIHGMIFLDVTEFAFSINIFFN